MESVCTNCKKDFLISRPHCTTCPLALRLASPFRVKSTHASCISGDGRTTPESGRLHAAKGLRTSSPLSLLPRTSSSVKQGADDSEANPFGVGVGGRTMRGSQARCLIVLASSHNMLRAIAGCA
jgi:hypothetical protein